MDLRLDELRELCRRFSALHDGQLSSAEIAALEQQLRQSPAARRLYIRYSRVCGGLSWDTAHSADPLLSSEHHTAGIAPSQAHSAALAFLSDLTQSMFGVFSRSSVFSLGAAGVLGAAVGMGLLLAFLSHRPTVHPQPTALTEAAAVPEIQSLKLATGSATLSLANIGQVVVEGPAEFELLGQKRARLAYGRIRMRVTEESGRGFVVETPGGEVIDLGTEFGLDVDRGGKSSLAVFEGMVDLRMPIVNSGDDRVERFELGEGAVFGSHGDWERLMSIVRDNDGTFLQDSETTRNGSQTIISKVTDNLQKADTKKFYQIVPGGLVEDALCYVDRPATQWNGTTAAGIPAYLSGADYVKTFNNDKKRSDVKIKVKLARPARLFVFFDDRLKTPEWLAKQFTNTGDKIGCDFGPWARNTRGYAEAVGAGQSIDAVFSVWEQRVEKPGTVTLEHNPGFDVHSSAMYGIAAVPLNSSSSTNQSTTEAKGR